MTEADLNRRFVAFLLEERGYPRITIAFPLTLRFDVRPDLGIVDPGTRAILAVVEYKVPTESIENPTVAFRGVALRIKAALPRPEIPVYLVLPHTNPYGFSTWTLNEDEGWAEVPIADFPTYATLLNLAVTSFAEKSRQSRESGVSTLERTGGLLALLAAELIILAFAGLWKPTAEILALVAAFGALTLLPQFTKIKIAGVELERTAQQAGGPGGTSDQGRPRP